jgi:HAD superfamily 5'-nucleotidase-like hydrolase
MGRSAGGGALSWCLLAAQLALESAAFKSVPSPVVTRAARLTAAAPARRSGSCPRHPAGPLALRMTSGGEAGAGKTPQPCAVDDQQDSPAACCPTPAENLPFFAPETTEYPLDYFGESTRGDLLPTAGMLGTDTFMQADELRDMCNELGLDKWGTPKTWGLPAQPQRSVFCSRTVNMRSISCIGYDMDYTLIHYKVTEWEGRAYLYAKENLEQVGFAVNDLVFDPELVCRGLIIDKKLGNMVKADRFGLVKRAMHGTRRLSIRDTHDVYGRQLVDLRESRWLFLNTLFSVSEGCLYAQLVEKLDRGSLMIRQPDGSEKPAGLTYEQLFNAVSKALFKAHVEGRLKNDVMKDPEKYVEFDSELPLTLLDQREAGKKLALITNSDWVYTKVMMQEVFDRFLPSVRIASSIPSCPRFFDPFLPSLLALVRSLRARGNGSWLDLDPLNSRSTVLSS